MLLELGTGEGIWLEDGDSNSVTEELLRVTRIVELKELETLERGVS